jgi:DNA-binding Lrp family transcriptional regulator
VYDLYAREPTIPLREAGARLGLSAPSVHRAKKKLEKAGLLPAAREALVAQA